jgi:hypothetical protein
VSLIRVLRTAAATLTRSFYVDETATDCTGSVTVAVTRLDGTAVASGTASHAGTGTYAYVLPGQAQLDALQVAWTGTLAGSPVTVTDDVEIVGGFFFGLAEARASDSALTDPVKFTTAGLAAARLYVEQECEAICFRAFVPRFRRVLLDGTGRDTLITPDVDLRVLRSASLSYITGGDKTALTGADLTRVVAAADGLLVRPSGLPWPYGRQTVLVEYEYGLDQPPEEVRQAGLKRLRTVLLARNSSIPDRVSSYTTSDGVSSNTYRLTQPGRRSTGIPDIDAVYQRYAAPPTGFA